MLTRKINAVISLLITLLIFAHAISIAVWMLSYGAVSRLPAIMSWVLVALVLVHAFISIEIVVSGLMSGEESKGKMYPKLNRTMIVQRVSGLLMIVFTGLHIAGATGAMQSPRIIHGIVPPLFFAIVMAHVAVSTSKAFITLGIGNARFIKTADIAIKAICAATLIADIVGFYLYVW
jgi:succinate dehydrogenase hydrophobic anchor subunit